MKFLGYVCLVACLFAASPMSDFRGRLLDGGFRSYDGLVVEVTNLRDRSICEHVDVSADGSFGFRTIPEGDYQVRVLTLYENEITSTVASIGPSSLPFEIRLPQAGSKPISGTVSFQQLTHPPSRQVQKLLQSGNKLIQDQHYDGAVARYREAVRDAPDCVQAHAGLGLAFSNLHQWDAAVEEFRAAISLDPRNSLLHGNLSAALASENRFDEAEHEASASLKLDPRNRGAHFVMAGILARKPGHASDVVKHLVSAQETIPSAKTALQNICAANHIDGCP